MANSSHSRRRRATLAIGDIASELVNPLASGEYGSITRLRLGWREICGPMLSSHSTPKVLNANVLLVETSSQQWSDAIANIHDSLVAQCRRVVPELEAIETIAAPTPEPPVASPATEPEARLETEDIAHDGLRNALNGLLEAVEIRRSKTP